MKPGTHIRIVKLTSDNGVLFDSLLPEYFHKVVGVIYDGPDAANCYRVNFPTLMEPMELPASIIDLAPRR